jgi:transcriptional regulator with XRE-family HTH domain
VSRSRKETAVPSSTKVSLIDYPRLAADIRARQEQEGLEMKQIAAQSGVDKSKLSILVNQKGGLATDNLLLICDWLGKSLHDYRLAKVPTWVVERLAESNELTVEEAEWLAARRSEAACRQAALSDALDQLDLPALAEAAQRSP